MKKHLVLHLCLLIIGLSIMTISCDKDNDDDNNNNNPTPNPADTTSFTDARDGQKYKKVKIGNQIWMAQNLNYDTSKGCGLYNTDSSITEIYSRYYEWETAVKVCPAGWHLPSLYEWNELTDFLGGSSIAGGKMKEIDTTHWRSQNTGATNE